MSVLHFPKFQKEVLSHDLKRYGADPISYSTLQPSMRYFKDDKGYIAYRNAFGYKVVLGSPVCSKENQLEMTRQFLNEHSRVVFGYVPEDFAKSLEAYEHFEFLPLGEEKIIRFASFHAETCKEIQGALKHARKHSFAVKPVDIKCETTREQFEEISRNYVRSSQNKREMRFINRPAQFADDGMARFFSLEKRGEIFGFAILDPYYSTQGDVEGYLLNICRFRKTQQWGVYFSTIHHLVEILKAEGVRELSLGLSPHIEAVASERRISPELLEEYTRLQNLTKAYYNVDGLVKSKQAIANHSVKRYLATPKQNAMLPTVLVAKANKLPWFLLALLQLKENYLPKSS